MSYPRFTIKKLEPRLLGRDQYDWSSYAAFFAPAIPDLGEVISLGDRYIASLGAHAMHGHLIMDREGKHPLSVSEAQLACAALAFATDSPVVLEHNQAKKPLRDERAFSATFQRSGLPSAEQYADVVSQVAQMSWSLESTPGYGAMRRCFTRRDLDADRWWHYPWPDRPSVARAVSAYSLGLISVPAPSRILNFWRALEAIVGAAAKARTEFFMRLENSRVTPVWGWSLEARWQTGREVRRNIAAPLRRLALAHWRRLLKVHGSIDLAVDYLYDKRRGKAAHADRVSLEYDFSADIAQQLADAVLLRYAARAAIEAAWYSHSA